MVVLQREYQFYDSGKWKNLAYKRMPGQLEIKKR